VGFRVQGLGVGVCKARYWFRFGFGGWGLVFKAHRLVHHSILGLRVMKKKKGWGCTWTHVAALGDAPFPIRTDDCTWFQGVHVLGFFFFSSLLLSSLELSDTKVYAP